MCNCFERLGSLRLEWYIVEDGDRTMGYYRPRFKVEALHSAYFECEIKSEVELGLRLGLGTTEEENMQQIALRLVGFGAAFY